MNRTHTTATIAAIALAALTFATNARADNWTGPDKTLHFLGGAAVASAVTMATDEPKYGFLAGAAVGVAKEIYDTQHRSTHTPSFKDFAVTALGAAVGAKGTAIILRRDFIGAQFTF